MKTFFITALVCGLVLFSLPPPVPAIMVALSTEKLTRASELVLMGEVTEVKAQWSSDRKTIFTSASVTIKEIFKGAVFSKEIVVEYEGGEVGDLGLLVSDTARLREGEKVFLFLKLSKSKKQGFAYHLVGKAQGKYTIDEQGIARRDGFATVRGPEVIENNIPVEALIDRINETMRE